MHCANANVLEVYSYFDIIGEAIDAESPGVHFWVAEALEALERQAEHDNPDARRY